MMVGLLTCADTLGVRAAPDIVDSARDFSFVCYAAQTALSFVLGISHVRPVWKPCVLSTDALRNAAGHLSSIAAMLHHMQLAQPLLESG